MRNYKGNFGNTSLKGWLKNQENSMGDFDMRQTSSMGDWWSDQMKNLESQAQDILAPAKQYVDAIDPNITRQLEAELVRTGTNLQSQATAALTAEAQKVLTDPATQNTAITSTINAAANQLSSTAISIKDSLLNGTILQKHPIFVGVTIGLPSLMFLKFMIGKKRTKVVYAAPPVKASAPVTAKANPKRRRNKRK